MALAEGLESLDKEDPLTGLCLNDGTVLSLRSVSDLMYMLSILETFDELLPLLGYWSYPYPSMAQAAYLNVTATNALVERLEDANPSQKTRTEVGKQIKEKCDTHLDKLETLLESKAN